MREARVLKGNRPLIYPGNPILGHVRLAKYVWARGQTCPVQTVLAIFDKLENL
jgi:hypothetical protein